MPMPSAGLVDGHGRVARKLRISVTDRCNFRCTFCMPEIPVWMPREEILTFEEIEHLTRIFVSLGIEKVRLTGGEPLLRRDIERLIAMLRHIPGLRGVTMTTNGYFLGEKVAALKAAGLQSATVSLHSLRPDRFAELTGRALYDRVFHGIHVARGAGLPVKLNAVIIRGYNEDEVVDLARLAHDEQLTVRFIEYMPFDGKRLWNVEKVFTGREIVARISERYALEPLPREPGSTALNYRFLDSAGTIGLITSISAPFCGDCDRVRLKADGKLVPCMFDNSEFDLKGLLRGGASDRDIEKYIRESVGLKAPGVETLIKELVPLQHIRPMHTIGG